MCRYSRDENKHREEHIVGGMKYDTVWSIQWWKNSHVQYWNVQFSVTRVLKSLSENPESDLHFWLQVKFLNTVCHLTQYYQFEGYYNRVHLRLKMMGEGCDAKKCSFAVSILVLLPRCKFHQLQQQRQLATILESCKFPRTIAELLSSLILLYSSLLLCSSTRCIFTGIWHICQKVKGFLTTSAHFLPYLFLAENSRIQMRSFVQIKTLETEEEA